MKWFLDVLRGMVIGLANVIPGVSGGTMMVSMGIYDKLIYSINHLFKRFRECFRILLPYLVGMVLAILLGSFALKAAFSSYPLPTNALFIGLILGSLPLILQQMKGEKIGWQGILIFILFFALVVWLKAIEKENTAAVQLNVGTILILFVLGCICSAAMIIPGVSGSMILKTLGYYEPVVTVAVALLTVRVPFAVVMPVKLAVTSFPSASKTVYPVTLESAVPASVRLPDTVQV